MLRITIELVPYGQERFAKVVGRGSIGNISDLTDLSDYRCTFEENAWKGRVHGPYSGVLTGWPRCKHGAWEIVHAALAAVLRSPTSGTDGAHFP
jgi:hypothetical protein